MKRAKNLTLLLALLCYTVARAYDFGVQCPTGQMLYYNITSVNTVAVCDPNWAPSNRPTGWVEVPATVSHNGTTYNVVAVGRQAFRFCSGLTRITLPEGLRTIGTLAFMGCSSLDTIELPSTLDSIAIEAFNGTGIITDTNNWTGGNRLFYIGQYLIKVRTSVSDSITIRDGTIGIAGMALDYCTHLDSVSLPASLKFIGPRAFAECDTLRAITMLGSLPPKAANDCFENMHDYTVYVPCASQAAYVASSFWNNQPLQEYGCSNPEVPDTTASDTTVYHDTITPTPHPYIPPHPFPVPIIDSTLRPDTALVGIGCVELPCEVVVSGRRVSVRGLRGQDAVLVDEGGRKLGVARRNVFQTDFNLPSSGVYFLCVEGYKPRAIVVAR